MGVENYKVEYNYEGNSYEITTPEGYLFTMHCEGTDKTSLAKSVNGCKFYPEQAMKRLLDNGKKLQEAYEEVSNKQKAYANMKKAFSESGD